MSAVWCVKVRVLARGATPERIEWCALRHQPRTREPRYRDVTPTACGFQVIYAGEFARREPDGIGCVSTLAHKPAQMARASRVHASPFRSHTERP